MDFETLVKRAQDPQAVAEAFSGFDDRQIAREKLFLERSEKNTPSEEWYERRYDV